MATIRDVASLAGVSHGTVTNVLNNSGNVKPEKVKAVMEAVETLGYHPQAAARSLKSASMDAIGIILPNVTDSFFAQFYSSVESALSDEGFSVMLFTTNDIPEREKQIISVVKSLRLKGVILITCQPDNHAYFQNLMTRLKLVLVEREVKDLDCNFIALNHDKSIHYAASLLAERTLTPIGIILGAEGYSSEEKCLLGYKRALEELNLPCSSEYISYTSGTNEAGFRAMSQLFQLKEPPKSIICTSTQLAEGAIGALNWSNQSVSIISLGETNWNDNRFPSIEIIPRPSLLLGEESVGLLLDNINNPVFFDKRRIFLNNEYVDFKSPAAPSKHHRETIRVMLPHGVCSKAAFDAMLPDLEKKVGVKAILEEYDFLSLYDKIKNNTGNTDSDVYIFDLSWLPDFASNGILYDLSSLIEEHQLQLDHIAPENMQQYMEYNHTTYALLHRFTGQLLFYRKDLFEDMSLRRMFFDQYNSELKAHTSWIEFNEIARFFTREFNPESPTSYGFTMGRAHPSAVTCDFLPRLWALGGNVFDSKVRVTLDSPEAVKALNTYIESTRYCSSHINEYGWSEDAQEFAKGDVAMLIEYPERSSCFAEHSLSSLIGKVGYESIPGNTPVIGGWLFGINKNSQKVNAAFEFIKWASSSECYMPITILEGLPATRELYSSVQLQVLYPWQNKAIEAIENSRARILPEHSLKRGILEYEQIIADAIQKALNGTPPKTALKEAADYMRSIYRVK